MIGDYDKRVISKTTLPTTPELFRGLIQAIWRKNYQIWLKKTPWTLQKTKSGYLGLFWALMALGEKATTEYYDSNATVFNLVTTRHLPDTLRHHPDTPRHPQTSPDTIQTPPYLACMRPLGERVISEYHDIYSTGLNLYDIYLPQTSAWHTQTPSRHCQTPWDTIQTP